ncbi:MAG: SusF/SusE family outer membrane protein [Phycisphaerae bacterium]|nr:SusF/SusE family outer membrane protein [Saprospiraceae bacterium]
MKLRLLFSALFCSLLFAGIGQAQSIGLIGSSTANGWNSDTNMIQNVDSAHLWSLKLNLIVGAVKFRQDDAWDINWGSKDFPSGIGTQGGVDIPIPAAGEWTVNFNSLTGAYSFAYTSDIGIIGDATPGGWADDTKMYYDPLDSTHYFITLNLIQGEAKFRANSAWDINWGAIDFPSGVGTLGGPNIPIPATGKYLIHFHKTSGEYSFEEVLEFATIGLIGSGTPGDWTTDTDLTKDSGDPNLWKGTITLTDGEAKFRANDAWAISWGDTLFPSGIGILNGPNIPVVAGKYVVTFNTQTYAYNFAPLVIYSTIGIIGNATPGDWLTDTDMNQDPVDSSIWRLRLIMTDGEAKFRANDDWAVNWGAGDFPTGIATEGGANIPITAGEYKITFNSFTGEYSFELLQIYGVVGLVGTATPNASWEMDVDLTKDLADESFWYINSIDMSAGEAKFRAEHAWAVNWGAVTFPTGVGTQNGPNIPITAGTYRATLNSATGEYAFGDPSSTIDLLRSNSVVIAPNPVKGMMNIQISAEELQGKLKVIIFNSQGAQVLTQNLNVQNQASIDVKNLVPGHYFVHIANDKFAVGKQVVIVK